MNIIKTGLVFLLLSSSVALFADCKPVDKELGPPTDQYIVEFHPGTGQAEALANSLAQSNNGQVGFIYQYAIQGFVFRGKNPEALLKNPNVKSVTPDGIATSYQQTIPTGIERIFADAKATATLTSSSGCRCGATVAVIDTGVDFNHTDLNVNTGMSRDFTSDGTGGNDNEGHGTHVAGTIGAHHNDEGVVGVCPGAEIVAVKVLTSAGSGTWSGVIAGIDYVTSQSASIDVANLSLGGAGCDPEGTMCTAIKGAKNAGVAVAVAAGNSNANATNYQPACCSEALTVSALDDRDGLAGSGTDPLASFSNWGSNWGPAVDIAAPGVLINSTLMGGGYGQLSGTSMASPHVAGALAVLASNNHPTSATMVDGMYTELKNKGNLDWTGADTDDDPKEPLLDMTNIVEASMVDCPALDGGPSEPTPSPPTPFPTSAPTAPPTAPPVGCDLADVGEFCGGNSDCCSNKCRGKSGRKKCKSA